MNETEGDEAQMAREALDEHAHQDALVLAVLAVAGELARIRSHLEGQARAQRHERRSRRG